MVKGKFSVDDVEILSSENAYQGFFQIRTLTLKHRLFKGGWSQPITRELFARNDAVGVLLFDPVLNSVALVEQFRVGVLGSDIAQRQKKNAVAFRVSGRTHRQRRNT